MKSCGRPLASWRVAWRKLFIRLHRLDFSFIDLIDADDPEGQADLIFREADSQEIDLETLPIMRHVLIRIAHDNYRLARILSRIISDGSASHILNAELAILYEARLQGMEPPLPKEPPLQYADYAVWQRQVMRPDGPYFNEVMSWWKSLISTAPPATRLPFRRLIPRAGLDPSEGVLQWKLEEWTAKRLDEIARSVGATHFTVRLAAFAALIADMTGNSTIVIGTNFVNRNHVDTQNIVGPFVNTIPLVFSYDATKTFREWLEIVRDRVFETRAHSELSYERVLNNSCECRALSHQRSRFFSRCRAITPTNTSGISSSAMSSGALEKCRGDAGFSSKSKNQKTAESILMPKSYDRNEMRAMLDRYLRLLEAAAREPELPIGKLLAMIGAKPLRWTCANYAAPFYTFITGFYASSPLLKMFWRSIKRWVS